MRTPISATITTAAARRRAITITVVTTMAMTTVARRTIIAAGLRHGTSARCARLFTITTAILYAGHPLLQVFIWCVVDHCLTAITVSVWIIVPWGGCRITRATNGAVQGATLC